VSDIISIRTYRDAEGRCFASNSTLLKIDRLFQGVRKEEKRKSTPDSIVLMSVERWFTLRSEHQGELPPREELQSEPQLPTEPSEQIEASEAEVVPGDTGEPDQRHSRVWLGGVAIGVLALLVAVVVYGLSRSGQAPVSRHALTTEVKAATPSSNPAVLSAVPTVTKKPPSHLPNLPLKSPAKPVASPLPPRQDKKILPKQDPPKGLATVDQPAPQTKKPEIPQKPAAPEKVPYAAKFISGSPFQATGYPLIHCNPGEELEFKVTVQNIGSEPWARIHRPISLGVVPGDPPTDKDRIDHGPVYVNWMDTYQDDQLGDRNRVYIPWKHVVYSGQFITFHFRLKVPEEPGPYPVTLQMVMDGFNIAATPSQDGWFKGESLRATFQVRDLDSGIKD